MRLWTIQPIEVYNDIINNGVYKCDIEKSSAKGWLDKYYDWLVGEMELRIGKKPDGVEYPVWAWFLYDNKTKADLRIERWEYGVNGERFACIELEIPDEEVLLSDFDSWSHILLDALLAYSEKENIILEEKYEALSEEEKIIFKHKNWERVFNIEPFNNDWIITGRFVQATFWELKKEYITNVRFFEAARKRNI